MTILSHPVHFQRGKRFSEGHQASRKHNAWHCLAEVIFTPETSPGKISSIQHTLT